MKGLQHYLLIAFTLFSFRGFTQWAGWKDFTAYTVPNPVHLLHIKDITGDRKPDLVTFFNAAEPSFAILQGKGDGSFYVAQQLDKEDNYHLSDIADLNKDGYPDMVISSYWNNGFKIYFGKGNNQFKDGIYMETGVHGRNIKCVDINKDGHMDVVTTTSGSGRTISLHVFLGKGDGSFHPKKTFPSVLDTSKEIYVLDKNGDGLLDVIVSSSFPWFVMFLQQADGSFKPKYHYTYNTAQLAFNDMNDDGKDDVILLYSSFDNDPGSDSLVIKLNAGDSSFATVRKLPLFTERGKRPAYFKMDDVNRDGYNDILFNHLDAEGFPTDSVFYMLGKPNLEFSQPAYLVLPAAITHLQTADLNGDFYPEWIIGCTDSKLYIVANGGSITPDSKTTFEIAPNPARNTVKLKTNFTHAYEVKLYSSDGRLAKTWRLATMINDLNIAGLSSGIYFMEVIGSKKRKTTAIIIQ
jgi:hypothetical protein